MAVFVDESAEHLLPLDMLGWPVVGDQSEGGSGRRRGQWRFLIEALVWSVGVVVLDVLVEDGEQVSLVEDQEPVLWGSKSLHVMGFGHDHVPCRCGCST
jgi:hypothetical protein